MRFAFSNPNVRATDQHDSGRTAAHTMKSFSGDPTPNGATASPSGDDVYDVIGVGFGPSGLALAAALYEKGAENVLFLEQQQSFGWHRGMMIDGSSMQVSFLKDLVTMRNPTSKFSFLAYLQQKGRLASFINHGVLTPSRLEFHDYLAWVADQFDHVVRYGTVVSGVRPIIANDAVEALDVLTTCGRVVGRARNIVIGTGLTPRLPQDIATSNRVWHSSEFTLRIPEFDTSPPERVIVVGAGQSAAEVALHLLQRYPSAQVCPVFTRYGYSTADTNPFANRIFDPSAVDDFYGAPAHVKLSLMEYHRNTNYSVADPAVLRELYRIQYEQSIAGQSRLRMFNVSRMTDVDIVNDHAVANIEFLPTGERTALKADLVILATGYESSDPMRLLGGVVGHLKTNEAGKLLVGRDYRLATGHEFRCNIYVQGATERTHGIASTLLSVAAVRAEEISESLITDSRGPASACAAWG